MTSASRINIMPVPLDSKFCFPYYRIIGFHKIPAKHISGIKSTSALHVYSKSMWGVNGGILYLNEALRKNKVVFSTKYFISKTKIH